MAAVVGAVVDGVVAGEEQVAAAAAVGWSTCSGLFFSSAFFRFPLFSRGAELPNKEERQISTQKGLAEKRCIFKQKGFQKCHFLKQ